MAEEWDKNRSFRNGDGGYVVVGETRHWALRYLDIKADQQERQWNKTFGGAFMMRLFSAKDGKHHCRTYGIFRISSVAPGPKSRRQNAGDGLFERTKMGRELDGGGLILFEKQKDGYVIIGFTLYHFKNTANKIERD